jgi:hypothetical protein
MASVFDPCAFVTWRPAPVKLRDGQTYPCRQISAAGGAFLARIVTGDTDGLTTDDLLSHVADCVEAPREVLARSSEEELFQILLRSNKAAAEMQQKLAEDAAKNGRGGTAKRPRPPKTKASR